MSYFLRFLEKNSDFSIDWVFGAVGDPMQDFARNIVSAISSPLFASAQIDAYFEGAVPDSFWQVLSIYTAIHELKITKLNFKSPVKNTTFVDY